MKHLEYKGYTGSIEYSQEDDLLYGKVLGIKGLISYEGTTGKELEQDFREAIDTYFEMCEDSSIKPENAFKGSFNVRIPSELHRDAALIVFESGSSLNGFVVEAIRSRILQMKSPRRPITKPKSAVNKVVRRTTRKSRKETA